MGWKLQVKVEVLTTRFNGTFAGGGAVWENWTLGVCWSGELRFEI
jgi:hypothetical protein